MKKNIILQVSKHLYSSPSSKRAQEGAAQLNAAQETITRKPGDLGEDLGCYGGGWFSLGRGGGIKQELALELGGLGQGLKENRVIPSVPGGDGGRRNTGNRALAGKYLGADIWAVIQQSLSPTLSIKLCFVGKALGIGSEGLGRGGRQELWQHCWENWTDLEETLSFQYSRGVVCHTASSTAPSTAEPVTDCVLFSQK